MRRLNGRRHGQIGSPKLRYRLIAAALIGGPNAQTKVVVIGDQIEQRRWSLAARKARCGTSMLARSSAAARLGEQQVTSAGRQRHRRKGAKCYLAAGSDVLGGGPGQGTALPAAALVISHFGGGPPAISFHQTLTVTSCASLVPRFPTHRKFCQLRTR